MNETLVLTGANETMREIHEITAPGKRDWAKKWGYDFVEITDWMRPEISPPVWQEMNFIAGLLHRYQRVVWLDADAMITNLEISAEMATANERAVHFVSRDWHTTTPELAPAYFNTGNMVLVRRPGWMELLGEMFRIGRERWWDRFGYEQSSLQEIKLGGGPLSDLICVLPGCMLNAVPRLVQADVSKENEWEPWCFLAHVTGVSNAERLAILTEMQRMVVDGFACDECSSQHAVAFFSGTGKKLCLGCYRRPGEIRIGWQRMGIGPDRK